MAAADRAINMALRVQGIGDVERDFKRAGDAGEKSFSRIEKSANGAAREVSDYTARLKRAAASAKADFANLQEFHKGDALTVARNRNAFVTDRVRSEQGRIRSGLPDLTIPGAAAGAKEADLFAAALRGVGGAAGIAGLALTALGGGVALSVDIFNDHENALRKFNATLSLSGNLSTATRDEIAAMADRIADATLQTEEAVLDAAAQLARVPGITSEALNDATEASARFADAVGSDVNDVAQQTGEVLTALAENDIKGLVEALDGNLAPAVATTIVQLAQAGKTAEAQQVYIKALNDAAGDGPSGLARTVDRLTDRWRNMAQTLGSLATDGITAGLGLIESALDGVRNYANATNSSLLRLLFTLGSADQARARTSNQDPANGNQFGGRAAVSQLLGGTQGQRDASGWAALRDSILDPDKPKRARAGRRGRSGGSGKSDAEREAEKLAREAEQARKAADRVTEANDNVVDSYRQRAAEARERLGLEGAALEAVTRRQEIEATVRRLSTDLIDKEVAARRAEAAAAKKPFDEAQARAAATAALTKQTDALREYATAAYDADKAQDRFLEQQERAAALFDQTRTPLEQVQREVAALVELYRAGAIGADVFNRRMNQLAEDMVDAAQRGRDVWEGFGADVSQSLRDVILNGGSAMDVLRQLIGITAGRLFDKNIGLPLADAIDGLTGNNRDKNVAAARAALPQASDLAAGSVGKLGVSADLAATALGRVAAAGDVGPVLGGLGNDAAGAGTALQAASRGATDFSSAAARFVASMAQGGGGGGGLFGTLLGVGLSLAGSAAGLKIGNTAGGAKAIGKTSGLGFAGGGYPPIGIPFDVGENGRERMILLPGGGARVFSGEQTRRMANDNATPTIIQNNIHIPAGADPRLTRDAVNRGTQVGISRATKKGLAAPARLK